MNKIVTLTSIFLLLTVSFNGSAAGRKPAKKSVRTAVSNSNPEMLTVKGVNYAMARVDGGTFTMGGTSEHFGDVQADERPVHSVTLSTYYIGKTEVTQALWKAVMGSNPSTVKGANLPVTDVSWDDCQRFISRLNSLTGMKFRLPTEAEWEYACRGGNKSRNYKYAGSALSDGVAWYESNSGDGTHPVGTKKANELGIHDMAGNVWEWCADWYGRYSSVASVNPKGPQSGDSRVFRGGSWFSEAADCRAACRDKSAPTYSSGTLGFRLAR